jgi:hypothetical protein
MYNIPTSVIGCTFTFRNKVDIIMFEIMFAATVNFLSERNMSQ